MCSDCENGVACGDEGYDEGELESCPDCAGTGERCVYLDSGAFLLYECATCAGTGTVGEQRSGGDGG